MNCEVLNELTIREEEKIALVRSVSVKETIVVERYASLQYVFVLSGNKEETIETRIELQGEGASVSLYGIVLGHKAAHTKVSITINHTAPHTSSLLHIRTVATGEAKVRCCGQLRVAPGASGCDARQEMNTLLLSGEARVETIPELSIANDEVRCSHAVTTTYINEEKKFYLESRGMNESEAVNTVVLGHLAPIISLIPDQILQTNIENIIAKLIAL